MYPEREALTFCDKCNHRVLPDEENKWHGLCRSCATDALVGFKHFLWSLRTSERKLLDDLFDGVSFCDFKEVRLKE